MLSIDSKKYSQKIKKFNDYSYRNIYTIIESQNLFDDLISNSEAKNDILQKWENNTSDISHEDRQKNRVFQYGNAENSIGGLFAPPYREGRFGDGHNYGVWYGALEQETSILESLYHQYKRVKNAFKQKASKDIITTERKMFKAKLQSERCLDLCFMSQRDKNLLNKLTNSTNYLFCQEMGKEALKNNITMFLTPSSRNISGICTPVFHENVIKQEQYIYYLRWIFYRDGKIEQEKISQEKSEFRLPEGWE